MNSNCITDIENKLVSEVYFKGKKILKARIISVSMVFGKNKLTTVTNSEIELEAAIEIFENMINQVGNFFLKPRRN